MVKKTGFLVKRQAVKLGVELVMGQWKANFHFFVKRQPVKLVVFARVKD